MRSGKIISSKDWSFKHNFDVCDDDTTFRYFKILKKQRNFIEK